MPVDPAPGRPARHVRSSPADQQSAITTGAHHVANLPAKLLSLGTCNDSAAPAASLDAAGVRGAALRSRGSPSVRQPCPGQVDQRRRGRRADSEFGARCRTRSDRRLPGRRRQRPARAAGSKPGAHLPGPSQGACRTARQDDPHARWIAGVGEGTLRISHRLAEEPGGRAALCCRAGAGRRECLSRRRADFGNRDLAKAAASILGDEAMHWAILRNALGETPVPSAFVS